MLQLHFKYYQLTTTIGTILLLSIILSNVFAAEVAIVKEGEKEGECDQYITDAVQPSAPRYEQLHEPHEASSLSEDEEPGSVRESDPQAELDTEKNVQILGNGNLRFPKKYKQYFADTFGVDLNIIENNLHFEKIVKNDGNTVTIFRPFYFLNDEQVPFSGKNDPDLLATFLGFVRAESVVVKKEGRSYFLKSARILLKKDRGVKGELVNGKSVIECLTCPIETLDLIQASEVKHTQELCAQVENLRKELSEKEKIICQLQQEIRRLQPKVLDKKFLIAKISDTLFFPYPSIKINELDNYPNVLYVKGTCQKIYSDGDLEVAGSPMGMAPLVSLKLPANQIGLCNKVKSAGPKIGDLIRCKGWKEPGTIHALTPTGGFIVQGKSARCSRLCYGHIELRTLPLDQSFYLVEREDAIY